MEYENTNSLDDPHVSPDHSAAEKLNVATAVGIEHLNENTSEASMDSGQSAQKKGKKKYPRVYKEYWCSYCGKHFTHKGNMQQHERSHTKQRPFSCNLCGVAYTKSSHLLQHRRKHAGEDESREFKSHRCSICDRSFHHKSSLDCHLRSHSKKCTFSCHKCDMKFRHKSSFNRHLKTHAGFKNYACDLCQKRFYDASDMRKHIATHTKIYECAFCKLRFAFSKGLEIHLKRHITCSTLKWRKRKHYIRTGQLKVSDTDNFEDNRGKSVEKSGKKANEYMNEDTDIYVGRLTNDGLDRINSQHLQKYSGERLKVQIETGREDKAKKLSVDNTVKNTPNLSEVSLEHKISVDNCQCTDIVENGKVLIDNEADRVINTGKEVNENNETVLEAATKTFKENKVSLNKDNNRNVSKYREKKYKTTKMFRGTDKYIKEGKTEEKAEIIHVKQEIEENDTEIHNEVASAKITLHEESVTTNINVKKEVVDNTVSKQKEIPETNIIAKREIGETVFNMEKKIVDNISKDTSTDEILEGRVERISHGNEAEIIEAFPGKINEIISDGSKVEENKELDSSCAMTVSIYMPKGKTGNGEYDVKTVESKPEDRSPDSYVLNLRKEDLEISQSENAQLADAYWKTSRNCETAKPRQKMFRLSRKMQGKGSGKVCFISKYCVVRPKSRKNKLEASVRCYREGVNKNAVTISGITPTQRKSTLSVLRHKNVDKTKHQNDRKFLNQASSKLEFITQYRYIKPKGAIYNAGCTTMNCFQTDVRKEPDLRKQSKKQKFKRSFPKKKIVNMNTDNTQQPNDDCTTVSGSTCRHCGKCFDKRDKYKLHLREHLKPKEFTCDDCKQSFSKWRDYSHHKCSDFRKKYDFICAHCDRTFGTEKLLNIHMNYKKKTCELCRKVFCTAEELNRHKRTHLRHACTKCSQKFETQWSLNMHTRKVHTTLQCDQCKKSFMYTCNLRRHIKQQHVNVWFKCQTCDVKFVSADSYKQHKKVCKPKGIQRKEHGKFGKSTAGVLDSGNNEEHLVNAEKLAEDKLEINDDVLNMKALDTDFLSGLSEKDEKMAHVSVMSSTIDTAEFDISGKISNKNVAETDDVTVLPEKDEIAAAVASISSIENGEFGEAGTGKLTEKAEKYDTFQREQAPLQDKEDAAVADGVNLTYFKAVGSENNSHYQNPEKVIGHDGIAEHAETFSSIENENLDDTVEKMPENQTHSNKHIISNALFEKMNETSIFICKKKEGNRLMTENLRSELKEIHNLETKSNPTPKAKTEGKGSLRIILNSMKNNMQLIAGRIKEKNSSAKSTVLRGYEESVKKSVQGLEIEESLDFRLNKEEMDGEKDNQVTLNENTENDEVIILDSNSDSDEDIQCLNALPKYTISNMITLDELERKKSPSDSEIQLLEDKDGGYEDEVILGKSFYKGKNSYTKFEQLKQETELLEEAGLNEEEKMFDKGLSKLIDNGNDRSDGCNTFAKGTSRYNTRKRKSDIVSNLKSEKLQKIEIDICDVTKKIDENVDTIANDHSNISSDADNYKKTTEIIVSDTSEMSSDSESEDDSEGYEECTIEEIQAMLSSCKKQ